MRRLASLAGRIYCQAFAAERQVVRQRHANSSTFIYQEEPMKRTRRAIGYVALALTACATPQQVTYDVAADKRL